jgi:hypothetical protein
VTSHRQRGLARSPQATPIFFPSAKADEVKLVSTKAMTQSIFCIGNPPVIAVRRMVNPTVEQNYGHAATAISVVKIILLVLAKVQAEPANIRQNCVKRATGRGRFGGFFFGE